MSAHAADTETATYRTCTITVTYFTVGVMSAHAADIVEAAEIRINNAYIGYFAVSASTSEETYIISS